MEARKTESFEWSECKVEVELSDTCDQKVLLKDPRMLQTTSVSNIFERLINTFGKCEFETWVAEQVLYAALKAMVQGDKFADLTKIAHANLYMGYKEWILVMPSRSFKERFLTLPIFKVVKREDDEVVLEFVPK